MTNHIVAQPCSLGDWRVIFPTTIGIIKMKILKSAGDQPTEVQTDLMRFGLMTLFCLAGIFVGLLLGACDFRDVEAQTGTNSKKARHMESIQSETTVQQSMPPIDAATPPEIETATFALG